MDLEPSPVPGRMMGLEPWLILHRRQGSCSKSKVYAKLFSALCSVKVTPQVQEVTHRSFRLGLGRTGQLPCGFYIRVNSLPEMRFLPGTPKLCS